MKKTLFLMFALLMGVSGMEATVTQPTLTTDPNNPVYYTIQSKRSNGYATYNGASAQVTHEQGIGYGSVWYFVKNGEGVSIVPAADPTKKLASTTSATENGVAWYLKESFNAGYFCVSRSAGDVTSGTNTTSDCWDANNSNTNIGTWKNVNGDAEGTSWTISELATGTVTALRTAYTSMIPEVPSGKYTILGPAATTITAATSGSDNDHWYIITQNRGGTETPIYNTGFNTALYRDASTSTPASLDNKAVSGCMKYMVRFISDDNGLYNIQFADGSYIVKPTKDMPDNGNNPKLTTYGPHAKFAFTLIEGSTKFSWNLGSLTGKRMDNNGVNSTVSYWGEGTVTDASASTAWSIYPVTLTEDIVYEFNTTGGAFFQSLTNNKAAANNVYCNLWLSKNAADRPQLKLKTSDASTTAGNNIRSNGALYTTNSSSYTYNLSVSEGEIKSYTIVGTAEGALSITPAGGTAELFAAGATVNKKVTLDSPAKQTSFTLSGSNQWLNVTKFIVEWETDATIVSSTNEITNDGIYTLEPHNAERGVMYAGEAYLDACGGHANTNYPANPAVAIDASDANQQFVLYTYNGNTYLYNVGRGKFVGTASDLYYQLTNTPTNKWAVSNGSYTNYFHLTSQADSKMATINAWMTATATMKGVTISNGKDYGVTGTTANEEANNFLLTRVGTLTSEQQTAIETIVENYVTLMTNLDKLGEYTIGTGLGEYTNSDFETEAYKEENIASIRAAAANYNATTLASVKDASAASITKMVINQPTGKFIRIKSTHGTYLSATASTESTGRLSFVSSENADNSTIFYYGGNKLVDFKNGLEANGRAVGTLGTEGLDYTFQASSSEGDKGKYVIRFNPDGVQLRWLYAWNTTGKHYADQNGSEDANCRFTLEEVTELPVSISGAGYATYCFPVKVTFNGNGTANAYVATSATASSIHFEEPDAFNAYQGILLKGDEGSYTFTVGGTGNELSDLLSGTTAAVTVASLGVAKGSTLCAFQKSGSDYGFFKYPTAQTTFPGFKAYYIYTPSSGNAGSNFFTLSFDDDDVTAIASAINGQILNGQYYDLQGRKVANPQKGQIYIQNGKKVLY